ncbi:sigma-54 dependent transcriptional regulator [Geothrix sp. 21YS21S-4]|uniref:sigma-54-dependent transcriptional regulator n=1 Tax=Geothrix sp. 21YS21S-4 TaxID=3068889 RepID=UPI0027BABC5B|nr:sigma-54 dependent transcriptional regulator [Geothrix sp. 21YS21S-4]
MARVLVVDDSKETCEFLEELLGGMGLDVAKATHPDRAIELLHKEAFDLLLSDINLEAKKDGLDLLREAKPLGVDTILLSGFGTLETAIEAVREGAFDFLSKPWNNEELKALVSRALARRQSSGQSAVQASPKGKRSLMIGSSPKMMAVYKTIASLQNSRATVLITGESGTGKELVARSIHLSSDRRDRAFVAVNCGALTETLLESELFGHVKGSFTGAVGEKPGLFEEASGGTIFLDEIGETSPSFQVRLLRVLQEQEIRRVGGNKTIKVDARVIAATNRDLPQMVKAGTFREDLYYRLSVVELAVPPLRERREDIAPLLDHFLAEFGQKDQQTYRLFPEARRVLEAYSWPGNVRELSNAVENLTQLSRGREITVDDLPAKIQADALKRALRRPEASDEMPALIEDWPSLDELERRYIQILVGRHKEKQRIAEILGVDRTTLYRKLKRYGFHDGD